jgi:hypothetical protein
MELSEHAIDKLKIYDLDSKIVLELIEKSNDIYFDNNENSFIRIFEMQFKHFVAVISIESRDVITLYRTDEKTINNRINKGRWTKK